MDPLCEFCGVVRAVVYCKSDSTRLCLHCDGCVHSANSLSRMHSRPLLYDKCNSQPTMIRCMDHKLSLCQGCDWNPNDCSALGHRHVALNCYTGCPSLAGFSRIWSFVFDANSSLGGWESFGTLPKSESCTNQCLEQTDHNGGTFGLVSDKLVKLNLASDMNLGWGSLKLFRQMQITRRIAKTKNFSFLKTQTSQRFRQIQRYCLTAKTNHFSFLKTQTSQRITH